MLLHELATNAAKYDALSVERGRVTLSWSMTREPTPLLVVRWQERSGPPAHDPERRGFSDRLIWLGLMEIGDVDLRYGTSGLEADLRAPPAQVQAS